MSVLKFNDEVREALDQNKPVVALESTIISHGMPYPQNVQMAIEVENLIREQGAVPATIAIMDGKICIGLSEDEIETLGNSTDAFKASIRDLPRVLSQNWVGATTVAATAYAADLAGIPIFATGGIGGVHRGVTETYDISGDLQTLSECNVCVFSAGVKSILDIPKTLEYLETLGVPTYGFETDRYPGFFVRDSGEPVEEINLHELVELLRTKDQLAWHRSVLVGVPVPEESELDPKVVDQTISDALIEADEKGISGKEVTPFLLDKIKETTGGQSLDTNIDLMKNNAITAAKVAVAYVQS